MSDQSSFQTISEPDLNHSLNTAGLPDTSDDNVKQVPLNLEVPTGLLNLYPRLAFTPYALERENNSINVLSLFHNAAKREIADLLSIILPAIRAIDHSDDSPSLHADLQPLSHWWNALLRYFFFVADTDVDVTKLVTTPAVSYASRAGDFHLADRLAKACKSLCDRYAFAMEYIFRAADRALLDYSKVPTRDAAEKLQVKFVSVVTFMLDSMHVTLDVANQAHKICDVSLSALERRIVDSLHSFAKDRKNVFMYMCVRWMNDESLIKHWIFKFGGLKGRIFYDSWKTAHYEQRILFVNTLAERHVPCCPTY